jgi:demethylmenaquinone methyltransferase/2-methoxy-6-polyprenyl-1,4-benzoquinol methylase
MFNIGKEKLSEFKNIRWQLASAEKIPFRDNTFDFYTISYGIRNVTDINLCLSEAIRVLKPGGRFMCLEFSKIENEILNNFYQKYSKVIPIIGKYIVGSSMPYKYLVDSIDKFYNQNELKKIMLNNGFYNVEFRNLSNGISAIHSGWKV